MMKIQLAQAVNCNMEQQHHFYQIISDTERPATRRARATRDVRTVCSSFRWHSLSHFHFWSTLTPTPTLTLTLTMTTAENVGHLRLKAKPTYRHRHHHDPLWTTSRSPPARPTSAAAAEQTANSANSEENYLMRIFLLQKCA